MTVAYPNSLFLIVSRKAVIGNGSAIVLEEQLTFCLI